MNINISTDYYPTSKLKILRALKDLFITRMILQNQVLYYILIHVLCTI